MNKQTWPIFRCAKLFFGLFGVVAFLTPAATAALKKYDVRHRMLIQYTEYSPQVEFLSGSHGLDVALTKTTAAGIRS